MLLLGILRKYGSLGTFQVIDLQFGMGEGTHHIILELYAQGNILLTDGDYNVLTLLRTHRFVSRRWTLFIYLYLFHYLGCGWHFLSGSFASILIL